MQVERHYEVSPERLFAVLTDEAFLAERGRRYGGAGEPLVERGPTEVVVTTVRQVTADKVPSIARRYLGDGRLVEVDRWRVPSETPGFAASLTVDSTMPLRMSGRHRITPSGAGCDYVITIDVNVKVALVGRAVRKAVEGQLTKLLSAEQRFTETWLTQQ